MWGYPFFYGENDLIMTTSTYTRDESLPCAKRSMRFDAQDTGMGGVWSTPPRDSQPPHAEPSHQRCLDAVSAVFL